MSEQSDFSAFLTNDSLLVNCNWFWKQSTPCLSTNDTDYNFLILGLLGLKSIQLPLAAMISLTWLQGPSTLSPALKIWICGQWMSWGLAGIVTKYWHNLQSTYACLLIDSNLWWFQSVWLCRRSCSYVEIKL